MRILPAAALALLAIGLSATAQAQQSGAILPFVGSAPETGLQLGLAYLRVRQPNDTLDTRPSSLMSNVVFTMEQQYRTFVESDRWTPGNERRRQWGVTLMSFPLPFAGPTVESEYDGGRIKNDVAEAWFTRSRRLRRDVWGSLGARLIANATPGRYPGSGPACDTLPLPPGCPLPPGQPIAHTTLMLVAGAARDTREGLFAPLGGQLLELTLAGAYNATASEPFARIRLDSRHYLGLGRSVLAVQGLLQGTEGPVPLDQIVVMGSSSVLRGYEMGSLRDNWLAGAQLEFRGPTTALKDRLGVVGFVGGAVMASRFDRLAQGGFFPSVGGGIRWRLDRRSRSGIRIDYAVGSRGNSGLYVAFNEAF